MLKMALEIRKLTYFSGIKFLKGKKAKRGDARHKNAGGRGEHMATGAAGCSQAASQLKQGLQSSEFWVLSKENVVSWRASFPYM